MKAPIKNSINHFGLPLLVLITALFLVAGCVTHSDPLAGWHFSSLDNLHSNKAIIEDYQDYIRKVHPNKIVGDISFFEDGTGQHAVSLEIFKNGSNSILYALFYDKENKRIKVIKYGYRKYQS